MSLEVQIQSFVFSFVYGMFFSLLLNLNYKFIFEAKLSIRIVVNILFVLNNVLLYFVLLRLINNGVLHFYFFLCLGVGFLVGETKNRALRRLTNKRRK